MSATAVKLTEYPEQAAVDPRLVDVFQCVHCHGHSSSEAKGVEVRGQKLACQACHQTYAVKHRIVDTILAATPSLTNELQGMAREAGMASEQWQDYKIREVSQALPTLEALQAGTSDDAGHYYKQTMMNFQQARALLPTVGPGSRVLEIGSEAPFAFLKVFQQLGADCHALNIYFPIPTPDPYYEWPIRALGDMNQLPYKDASFDVLVISATSHHTPTPERLLAEVARVLKPGGKALLINDPLAGWIKGVGGSLAHHRDPLINENTYTLGRYKRAFKTVQLSAEHLFSAYWNDRLENANIHPDTRFAFLARILARLWQVAPLRNALRKQMLPVFQTVFGFPLNVVLTKAP